MKTQSLSLAQARRITLAAQGFNDHAPAKVDRRHLRKMFGRIGLLQVDSVNVLARSEELPVFARLGNHDRTAVRRMEHDGELFEYWGHEASLLPVEIEPFLRHRMTQFFDGPWRTVAEVKVKNPGLIEAIYEEVRDTGPIRASDLTGATRKTEKWWGWSDHKAVLEYLFAIGRLSARRAPNNFERLYDIRERILPARILAVPTPADHDARKELVARSVRHHGIGTMRCLNDYYRLHTPTTKPVYAELVEEGRLVPVMIDGNETVHYLDPDAAMPRTVHARALLSPFDPIVWDRPRAERLWDFHYRIEIYTPAAKRIYGYYVLPFLLNEAIVARVDLKSDRRAGVLLVNGAFAERGIDVRQIAPELAAELKAMAAWLGLATVKVANNGDLAPSVKRAVAAR